MASQKKTYSVKILKNPILCKQVKNLNFMKEEIVKNNHRSLKPPNN